MRGFTLLELLLVASIIAMASAGVAFAVRDSSQTQLEREAQRLVALLEAARAQSRVTGLPVFWHAVPQGFEFVGLPVLPVVAAAGTEVPVAGSKHTPWLADGISVQEGAVLVLGPEPIIEPQQLVLVQSGQRVRIATDGLHGFAVVTAAAPQTSGGRP